ncbi:MAG: hypothetical protein Q9180_007886 [Flavoplaca navasiana]
MADSASRLSHQYDRLAKKIGLVRESEKPDPAECREALKAWFKNPYGTDSNTASGERLSDRSDGKLLRWLLVLDNVEDWATIDNYWPDKGRGSVLITSRRPDVRKESQHSEATGRLQLQLLPVSEAATVLKHYAGYGDDQSSTVEAAARDITARLEGLPLAVMQVGSYIKECQMSIPEFCHVHRKDSDLYNVYLEKSPLQGYEHNLESVWGVESLSLDKEASREAFALLCVLAFLDSEEIQEDLLKPDTKRGQMADYPSDEPLFHQRCRLLISTSLVERESSLSAVAVHRMVQKVVRAKVARDATLAAGVFDEVLVRLTSQWPYIHRTYAIGSQGKIDRWPRCAKLIPHVSALTQGYLELREKAALEKADLDLAELLCEASG